LKTIINLVDDGQLWKFQGGIKPPTRKAQTNRVGISAIALPPRLYLSLSQHIGQAAIPVVAVGDYVNKGQLLAKQDGYISATIIAPTSGTISDIALHSNTHASGIETPTIILTPDHLEQWREQIPLTLSDDKEVLLARISQSGITGLGGASFPTAVKLAPKAAIDFLIINGAECEPYITADDLLMQERSDTIIAGIEIMNKLLTPRRIIVAIEDNKPLAIAALTQAVARAADRVDIIVRSIPTIYPAGGEKQLIEMLTSKQVPSGKIPADIGMVVQNVATSYAVAQAVLKDQPLLTRIVTVSGDLVDKPGNYEVAIGTPIETVLAHAQFKAQPHQKIIIGGPMMGFALHHIDAPVVKATNCIIGASNKELPEPPPEQNCIRCGDCEQVCPANLLPQQLQWYAKDQDQQKLLDHNLFDCIECGACAFVCPSAIPLVQYYRVAKAEIRHSNEEKRQADRAKERFEQRNLRLERDKEEREQRSKKAAEARKAAMATTSDGGAVAAALARVKAKKAAAAALSATTSSTATPADASKDTSKDRVAQAIARAKAKKEQASTEITGDSPAESAPNTDLDPKKARIAAAVARAKAKKEQATQTSTVTTDDSTAESAPDTELDPQKARVAAAITRAKAKRAAQQAATDESPSDKAQDAASESTVAPDSEPEALAEIDPQKARVAAAIARAKVKRAAQQTATDESPSDKAQDVASESTVAPDSEPESLAEIDPQKARVAAAIARAKAKRAAQQTATDESPSNVTQDVASESTVSPDSEPEASAEIDPQKARVAAAIARAKAKRAAQQTATDESPSDHPINEEPQDVTSESSEMPDSEPQITEQTPASEHKTIPASDDKKARIAAAIAKAKAKKLAKQTDHNNNQDQT